MQIFYDFETNAVYISSEDTPHLSGNLQAEDSSGDYIIIESLVTDIVLFDGPYTDITDEGGHGFSSKEEALDYLHTIFTL